MVKSGTTKKVERSEATNFLFKASDFYEGMQRSMTDENWNMVGLSAVHCLISCSDALLEHHAGIKNTNQDHKKASDLVVSMTKLRDAKEQSKHFDSVINKKNLIEYEGRSLKKKEAESICLHTEKYYKWTCENVRT
ncbi:MAG: hypothetical protein ACI9BD_000419 [Candidatus Marinamargulisbacteria bacterium]|jgi:hypothetical protein